jgi:hypothetical protein
MEEDQALIDLLTQISGEARPHFKHYAKHQYDFEARARAEWLAAQPSPHKMEELRKPLQIALQNHPILRASESRFFGAKQVMIDPWYGAYNLLKVALDRGPTAAIAWLHKIYSTKQADLRYVVEIHGLRFGKQIALSNGVRLMPLEQLPPSPQARGLIAQYEAFPSFPYALPMFPAIGATFEVQGVHASADFVSGREPGPRSSELEHTIQAFAMAGEASPILGIGWLEFTDPDLALADYGQMWMTPIRETDVRNSHPIEINEEALEWVERYIRLPSEVRRVCDVAIERLALARRRHYPGNKAIEGAICLEALLLGDGENQELTYRLRLRAALLLTTNLNARREISRAIRDFYNLRSTTVHGLATSADEAAQNACAKRGLEICADALRAIVKMNKKYIPQDWELSGGRPVAPDC